MYKSSFCPAGIKLAAATAVFTIGLMFNTVSAAETFYTTVNLNLRSEPNTESTIILLSKSGTAVNVTEYDPEGWSKVTVDGQEGFMKSEFLGKEAPPELGITPDSSTVEQTPWDEAKEIFQIGVSAAVYDVYTGNTYYVKSFSNGKHADVEPVTTDDTAIMKKTFGGVWSWDVRPVWVTINGRTMAASINGMPHGGGVNGNNGMDGQICIHFIGSSTHNGNSSYTQLHQQKALEAYNLSR